MKRLSIIGFLFIFMLAGCRHPTPTGTVIAAQPPWLFHYAQYAPRISVERPDGSEIKLNKVGGPFFIVGFISPPGKDPGYISPAIQKIADSLWLDSIDVIQITLPTRNCPLKARSIVACPPPTRNLHRFFDPKQIAWRAFNEPKPGTLLLINRRNLMPIIDTRGTVEDSSWLVHRSGQLQIRWQHDQREMGSP